jgi:RNA-directed DNA polymerase
MLKLSKEQIENIDKAASDPLVIEVLKRKNKGYVKFPVEKKNGKNRWIHSPHFLVKSAQDIVLQNLPTPSVKHYGYEVINGFCPGRGIVGNATPHLKKPVILSIDIKNYFPSFKPVEIDTLLKESGLTGRRRRVLDLLTTARVALPQGAPTSPMIANWLSVGGDIKIAEYCKKHTLDFTRYADDLTFSSAKSYIDQEVVQTLINMINTVYGKGIRVAPRKIKFMRSNKQQRVTGIVVNERINIPRARRRKLRAFMHHAMTESLSAALAVESRSINEVFGEISFLHLTKPELARVYIKQLQGLRGEK